MDLTLTRTSYVSQATCGELELNGETLYSIEQPWRDNEKGRSCVPEGTYDLVPYRSPKHGATWYLRNHALGVGDIGENRSYCELHAANWATQLEGCVALGHDNQPMVDPSTGQIAPAVEGSRDAIATLTAALGEMTTGHTLTITSPTGVPTWASSQT